MRAAHLPARPEPPRQLYDHDHTFGVAHDLERMRAGLPPSPRAPRIRTRAARRGGGPLAATRSWWANREHGPADIWHRFRCRTGHHDFRGGDQLQLGARFVYVERRCQWCDARPLP